jgi:hypothetical protein
MSAQGRVAAEKHPEDALYVFGPEYGGLPKPVRLLRHRFVVIPTHHCLNLAAVNVALYDRRLKRTLAGLEPLGPVRDLLHEHRWPVGGIHSQTPPSGLSRWSDD